MQVTMLKTVAGKHGLLRTGATVTVDDRYGKHLIKNGFAVEKKLEERKPDTNKNLGDAPHTKEEGGDDDGEEEGDEDDKEDGEGNESDSGDDDPGDSESSRDQDSSEKDNDSAARRGGGRTKPVSSRQVARRSRKRT